MQIPIDLGGETIEAELPEVPITFAIAPGGTLYGFLENFFPENLLAKGELFDAEHCREIRQNTRMIGLTGPIKATPGTSSAGK